MGVAVYIIGGGNHSKINPLLDSNILRSEQNLWDIGDRVYPAIEKVTLSGSLQTQPRSEEELDRRDYLIEYNTLIF